MWGQAAAQRVILRPPFVICSHRAHPRLCGPGAAGHLNWSGRRTGRATPLTADRSGHRTCERAGWQSVAQGIESYFVSAA